MVNPLEVVTNFFFQNIFFFLCIGFGLFFILTYLKFGSKSKYKVIDREEVERQKFVEMMRFNRSKNFKTLYQADIRYFNGGEGLIKNPFITDEKKVGNIEAYLEFEQTPIKMVEKQGIQTYEEEIGTKKMKLIALLIKQPIFWFISNPFAKGQPMLIENNETTIKDLKKGRIVIPNEIGFDRFMGYYYSINENTKPKLRNILDARVLVTDFNIMASRYFAKSAEQAVYSPEMAMQVVNKEKELQVELAKKSGKQQTL